MEVPRFAAVGLSLLLAANCFMPCYTFAYADVTNDGGASNEQLREDKQERAGDGQVVQGPDFQGVLWHETAEKASSGAELPPADDACRVLIIAHVLVEASYSLADSLIRFASARAYADESQEVENVLQEEQKEVPVSSGRSEFSTGDGESSFNAPDGGATAERPGGDSGASEEAREDSSGIDGRGSLDDTSISLQLSGAAQDAVSDFSHDSINLDSLSIDSDSVEVSDSLASSSFNIGVNSASPNDFGVMTLADSGGAFSNRTGFGGTADYSLLNVRIFRSSGRSSWGDSYNNMYSTQLYSGLTAHGVWDLVGFMYDLLSNSSTLLTYVNNFYNLVKNDGETMRNMVNNLYSRLATTNSNLDNLLLLQRKQWGYGYGGTVVIESNSPAAWLQSIASDFTVYKDMFNNLYNLTKNDGSTLRNMVNNLYSRMATTNENIDNFYNLVKQYWQSDSSFLSKAFDNQNSLINNFYNLVKGDNTTLKNMVDNVYNRLGTMDEHIDNFYNLVKQYGQSDSSLLSRGFSDVLDKLGNLSVSVELDLSGVESRLDSIIRLLTVAGVVENSKDFLDAIFGDMSLDATEAASAAVGSAIQNAFPFCVPAVLKQILGLLQADPAPPDFHFDFWGAPLDFGFSDWQGLADMTSWLSRVGFAVALFANSRRFVYSGGVAGD